MAVEYALSGEARRAGHPNRDRAQGFVPGVVYGHRVSPVPLRVAKRELVLLLSRGGAHHLVELNVAGAAAPQTVVVKEVQRNPVSREIVHVDFQAVSAAERIHADVPLRLLGEDVVAKAGGVLQVLLHSVRASCLPKDLPDHIEVDVSRVGQGHSIAVRDLKAAAEVTILNEPDETVLSVLTPRTAEPEAPAAAAADASPAGDAKA